MEVILPSVEIITEPDPLKRIELAGRVCYKSENKITEDSAIAFAKKLIERGHLSPLEHARVTLDTHNKPPRGALRPEPYGFQDRIGYDDDMNTVYANVRDLLAVGYYLDDVVRLPNAQDYMTVRFICDRGVSHELVRHRNMSFNQESTRYCCYKGPVQFILPLPFVGYGDSKPSILEPNKEAAWKALCYQSEQTYHCLLNMGVSPQEARNVLPMSLKTEVVMTGTYVHWSDVLKLRMDKAAHPQMQYLMGLLVKDPLFPSDHIMVPQIDE